MTSPDLTRRELLGASAVGAVALALPGSSRAGTPPLQASAFPELDRQGDRPWLGLATSLESEARYAAEVGGRLPAELRGVLYRNGPGRFERGTLRKRCVLDGDGMLQRFTFTDTGVDYQNRFTRTDKWLAEEAAGELRYATWTTQAPGGAFSNLFARAMAAQAGVSVVRKQDRLYAFDESTQPWVVDADSFETLGQGELPGSGVFSAHSKTDPVTGEWLHFGLGYGRVATAHFTRIAPDGKLLEARSYPLPRYVYQHDWFATERHFVLNLHPAEMSIFRFLFGRSSLAAAIDWKPEQGNLLMIVPREGEGEPRFIEAGASWMWHSLNAFERGGEIVADFVGYDAPDAFIGDEPALWTVMEGRPGADSPGRLRRYVIDVAAGRAREETLADSWCEFPIVDPRRSTRVHRYGYVAESDGRTPFWRRIARTDTETGGVDRFDFGDSAWCGEPIFAPAPGSHDEARGWLLTLVYDGSERTSYLAVLDAEHLSDGPVARVHLRHHVPLSFHGYWHAA